MIRLLLAAVAALLVSACVHNPIMPVTMSAPAPAQHKVERNYQLGVETSAFVGNPMVRVKDYWVSHRDSGTFTLPVPVVYHHHPFGGTESFPAGTVAVLAGYAMDQGERRKVVVLPGKDARFFPLLVDDSGHYTGRVLNMLAGGAPFAPGDGKILSIDLPPDGLTFPTSTAEIVSSDGGYLNFELVYAGSNASTINLIYREYTPNDLARPAFTQNLTYDKSAQTIRFKNIRIDVLSADNESIHYVVQADGLSDAAGS